MWNQGKGEPHPTDHREPDPKAGDNHPELANLTTR
jgi:hypothetical protein